MGRGKSGLRVGRSGAGGGRTRGVDAGIQKICSTAEGGLRHTRYGLGEALTAAAAKTREEKPTSRLEGTWEVRPYVPKEARAGHREKMGRSER